MSDDLPIEAIAKRRLNILGEPGRAVTVTLGKPVQKADLEWACPVDIEGIPNGGRNWVHGVDAVQALQLSMEAVRKALNESGLPIAWYDGEPGETGFPMYVPYTFGREFSERIERLIEAELEQFVEEKQTVRAGKRSPG